MPLRDRFLAVLVALCWGLNFPAIHLSLEQFPPFFLVAVRFSLIAVPTLLLVRRPAVPWRWILGYGFGFGVLQFVFLYLAMATGMPTGLASLVLQSSAPFTVLLGGVLLHERLRAPQAAGIGLAVLGLVGIAVHRSGLGGGATLLPVVLTLCGGLGWAFGNLANRQARAAEPFRLTLWMSVVPPIPLLALSLAVEGPDAIRTSLTTLGTRQGALALGGLLFTVVIATVVGSGVWTSLMARHPSSVVAPFSMLVPVVGIAASWLLLREATPLVEIALGALVVAGVVLGARPAGTSSRRAPGRSADRWAGPPAGLSAGQPTDATSAVATAATPSPRPVSPRPSVVVAETLTGAPAAADITASASARR
ncbi:EamA family transporter [Cellulomonas sp.]|uniref:EamA family transporter n=1 Tax=Cellulomonas sp. TaxID=40001 RepID=UPI0039C87EBA